MPRKIIPIGATIVISVVAGCASPVKQLHSPLNAENTRHVPVRVKAVSAASVSSSAGYESSIRANTSWEYFGTLNEGVVYRPVDTALMVRGEYNHEAYLVVSDGKWVGFFLPYENSYSPAKEPTRLLLTKTEAADGKIKKH